MAAIFVSKRRIDLSVDSESCLSPSAFGATEVTFRTGQFFRVPRGLWTISNDTCDDRRVLVDDGLDSGVVVVDGLNGGSGGHGECVTDVNDIILQYDLLYGHKNKTTFYEIVADMPVKVFCMKSELSSTCSHVSLCRT